MDALALKFFTSFLIMPLLAILFGVVVFFIAKKNKILNNKKFIFYVLAASVLLALPGFLGFLDYSFMPHTYLLLQMLYFALGWYNLIFIKKFLKELNGKPYGFELLFIFTVMLLGAALFSLAFNWMNELQYGLWACTCILPFMFTSLFGKAYRTYLAIPLEIYKVWSYTPGMSWDKGESLDRNRLMVIDMELFKNTDETDLLRITAKTSGNVTFGTWFYIFLDDYNKKQPLKPILYFDPEDPYGWIFYVKPSFFKRRHYIDPDLTFKENGIKARYAIMARRVKNEIIIENSTINE